VTNLEPDARDQFLLGLDIWLMDIRSRVFNLSVRVHNLRFPPERLMPTDAPVPQAPRQFTLNDL
jgi:hypothetical protein